MFTDFKVGQEDDPGMAEEEGCFVCRKGVEKFQEKQKSLNFYNHVCIEINQGHEGGEFSLSSPVNQGAVSLNEKNEYVKPSNLNLSHSTLGITSPEEFMFRLLT
ncbi:hypothetical protein DSECCO2_08220 [anaerobic digester metagenome]